MWWYLSCFPHRIRGCLLSSLMGITEYYFGQFCQVPVSGLHRSSWRNSWCLSVSLWIITDVYRPGELFQPSPALGNRTVHGRVSLSHVYSHRQRPRFCHLGNVRRPPQTQLSRSKTPALSSVILFPLASAQGCPHSLPRVTVICQGTPLSSPLPSPLQKSAFFLNSVGAQAQVTVIPVGPAGFPLSGLCRPPLYWASHPQASRCD